MRGNKSKNQKKVQSKQQQNDEQSKKETGEKFFVNSKTAITIK